MADRYDAIIIGAGVIGANIAFELSKAGYRTVNLDKLPAAGYGSTANSCAIIRTHYSTWQGVSLAYEGVFYWRDWPNYLETDDERGLIEYIECGAVYLGDEERYSEKVLPIFDEIGIPYEIWDNETLAERITGINPARFAPATRAEDERFWDEPSEELSGAIFSPVAGYVTDPQLAPYQVKFGAEMGSKKKGSNRFFSFFFGSTPFLRSG